MSFLSRASPTQAALASAASFAVGAALPIGVVLIATPAQLMLWISIASLHFWRAWASHRQGSARAPGRALPLISIQRL